MLSYRTYVNKHESLNPDKLICITSRKRDRYRVTATLTVEMVLISLRAILLRSLSAFVLITLITRENTPVRRDSAIFRCNVALN